LSGAASGAFAFLTGTLVRKGMRKRSIGRVAIGAAALLLFFGKLTWEVLAGTPLFAGNSGTSIKVAYSVHFVGLASGLAVAWAPRNLAAARSADVSKRIVDRSVEHCA